MNTETSLHWTQISHAPLILWSHSYSCVYSSSDLPSSSQLVTEILSNFPVSSQSLQIWDVRTESDTRMPQSFADWSKTFGFHSKYDWRMWSKRVTRFVMPLKMQLWLQGEDWILKWWKEDARWPIRRPCRSPGPSEHSHGSPGEKWGWLELGW